MLSKPQAGWTTLTIHDREFPCSYTTDVPLDILDSMIASLEHNVPFCVLFDGENNGNLMLISTSQFYYETLIIVDNEEREYIQYDISYNDCIKTLLNDIELYTQEWCDWVDNEGMEREEMIKSKIQYIKELFAKYNI